MSYRLLSENNLKATKSHNCMWCADKVLIGEQYVRDVSVYNSDFQNNAWHPECWDAVKRLWEEDEYDPHSFKRGTIESR
jgi:hypothetical protein